MQDNGQDTSSDAYDDMSEGAWITYAELARSRGINLTSAFKLAQRHHWRRQKDNQGQVRVLVPAGWAGGSDKSQDGRQDMSQVAATFEQALTAIREAKDAEIATLRDMVGGLRDTVARAETRAVSAERRAIEAEAAAAGERERVEAAQAETEEARRTLDQIRRADDARRARGRWARLRDAWRGE